MSVNGVSTTPEPSPTDVDAAIRAVLVGRLTSVRAEFSGSHAIANDVFAGRLLSLRQAEVLSSEVSAIKVAPGTVITPLAKDHLKQRGIAVRFVAKGELSQVRNQGEWGFTIESVSGLIEAFRRSLLSADEVWHEVGTTLEHSIHWLSEVDGRGVMHLTDDASSAVFRACQAPSVRAALAYDVDSAARSVRALGTNLLVVEPAGKSISTLRQLGATFRRAGRPLAPEWLAKGASR